MLKQFWGLGRFCLRPAFCLAYYPLLCRDPERRLTETNVRLNHKKIVAGMQALLWG